MYAWLIAAIEELHPFGSTAILQVNHTEAMLCIVLMLYWQSFVTITAQIAIMKVTSRPIGGSCHKLCTKETCFDAGQTGVGNI